MNFRQLFLLLAVIFSPLSHAHVQWFVAPEEMKDVYFEFDSFYLATFVFVGFFTTLALIITNLKNKPAFLNAIVSGNINISKRAFVMVFVVIQVIFFSLQVINGGFLAPNIVLPPEYLALGIALQLGVVVSASVSVMVSGIFVLLTTLLMIAMTPATIWINYALEFVAIGVFMIFCGSHVSSIDSKLVQKLRLPSAEQLWHNALLVLRVGIGLQLAVLAMTEKLIYPGLAVVFIEMFPFYNIFPTIGLPMGTNLHFVFFVGICELALGLLLALGVANRLTMLMATFAFVTTAIIHGVQEVEGHLPIFAAAFVLLLALKNKRKKEDVSLVTGALV
ncbi:hypothetical protein [Enterovibrio coralii]|uniref:DoxX family protein n=1 Tax=Enterovibrio coralii TaxID=294935 RepID=A0A135I6A1_9GAMM|nr:hypothetical protein [Enterovibrio coralii]KXF80975.1 hypothetical protein ATN88_18175 [Enterovibrio coralii]